MRVLTLMTDLIYSIGFTELGFLRGNQPGIPDILIPNDNSLSVPQKTYEPFLFGDELFDRDVVFSIPHEYRKVIIARIESDKLIIL